MLEMIWAFDVPTMKFQSNIHVKYAKAGLENYTTQYCLK